MRTRALEYWCPSSNVCECFVILLSSNVDWVCTICSSESYINLPLCIHNFLALCQHLVNLIGSRGECGGMEKISATLLETYYYNNFSFKVNYYLKKSCSIAYQFFSESYLWWLNFPFLLFFYGVHAYFSVIDTISSTWLLLLTI